MNSTRPFDFSIVPGHVIDSVIRENIVNVIELIAETYLAHSASLTVNPASVFLRPPAQPNARIIALPAHIGGGAPISGLKWIASYPDNIQRNVPRASAVLLLNNAETGYPFACLESSVISAARTAASAALAARILTRKNGEARKIAIIGAGLIARYIADFLIGSNWPVSEVAIYDLVPTYSSQLAAHFAASGWSDAITASTVESAVRGAQMVIFATTAGSPYLSNPLLFSQTDLVLHVSLRDLAPEIILSADNILDDVDHCLTAETSPHLAEKLVGNRHFVNGTLADAMMGHINRNDQRPTIFSPFGLGVLDVALGRFVYEKARSLGSSIPIDDFFFEKARWSQVDSGKNLATV
jgi:2,3-diaminopropionate biosynthesis protein SbnB